ncbi:uncharacterized protein LOC110384950 isoform X1 [Bombyx mori]|uniref:Peroxisomal ATPase PEX6 n=2 Tax=Bombyx mori TaxID=7091 RepID=A0A8R2R4A5_BOMMO|nr:peroxisome biogenesis protein 6 isoform X1 [Bombyx mori]
MINKLQFKLWVLRFCLKIVYPKFNFYTFLVFLTIKHRIWYERRLRGAKIMDHFTIKSVPAHIVQSLVKNNLDNNPAVVLNKCIVISKEQYIQLASENLFYVDRGVLWLSLKLSTNYKNKHKRKKQHNTKEHLHKFAFMTSEIHKKLWADRTADDIENIRIVPVVGSKLLKPDIGFVTENELHNMSSCFGLNDFNDIEITFHPVPSLLCSPKIAITAEVSLLLNDYDLDNDFTKEVLTNHFEIPRLVSINDVFSIELTPTMTTKYHCKYLDLVESTGKLYFKCTKLTSDLEIDGNPTTSNNKVIKPYFIVRRVTQLTLGENIHATKPQDKYFKPQGFDDNLHMLELCPTGLKHIFNQIQETISPFLNEDLSDLSLFLSSPIIPMLALTGCLGSGRHLAVKTLAKFNGINCLSIDCNALQSSTAKQTESKINATIQKAKAAAPVIVLLDNFEVFAIDAENNEDCRVIEYFMNTITDLYQNYTKHPIIFIAVTKDIEFKPNISRLFLEKFHIPKLNLRQRYEMLDWFSNVMRLNIDGAEHVKANELLVKQTPVNVNSQNVLQRVAAKTETFLYGDLDTLVHFATRESYLRQHNNYNQLPPDPDLRLIKEEDFNSALESIRKLQSQHLDAPKIPKVYWDDIGGLEKLKKELLKTIQLPIKYPHLFKNASLKRSGILLYGPPGCGKTLVAKAVSTELNVSFLSVKGPELLNMYIGQSEENVRKVFESARASSPCIIFVDELDALAPRRGAAGDSAGASDRVVSQLLAELDGVNTSGDEDTSSFVFIMGATNRPDLLEQSLLRPGRLDKLVYVGPYCGTREKTSVLEALCRKYKLRPEVNLEAVAEALPDKCTGADLLQVVSTARSAAVRALVAKLHNGTLKESELSPDSIVIGVTELWEGVVSFRPSVTDDELSHYEAMESQM